MSRSELVDLYEMLQVEHQRRKDLGGYNADAPTIALIIKALLIIVRHIVNLRPPVRRVAKKKK